MEQIQSFSFAELAENLKQNLGRLFDSDVTDSWRLNRRRDGLLKQHQALEAEMNRTEDPYNSDAGMGAVYVYGRKRQGAFDALPFLPGERAIIYALEEAQRRYNSIKETIKYYEERLKLSDNAENITRLLVKKRELLLETLYRAQGLNEALHAIQRSGYTSLEGDLEAMRWQAMVNGWPAIGG